MARATCGIYEALWLVRLHHASARALYLHIPFCVRKCAYCDFSSWATARHDPLLGAYASALSRLMWQAHDAGLLQGLETAYIGGGTPTMLGDELAALAGGVRELVPGLKELTCEANPDSLTDGLLDRLSAAGCTRLSLGVQSLNDRELRELGRLHDAALAEERLRAAVASGMDVSCDLMCAIPVQTEMSWERSLRMALSCGVGHLSVYPLQIEEGTPFDERYSASEQPWNDSSVQAARMEAAGRVLSEAGLARYEVASYAKPGKECLHNKAYWTAVPYLGIGTGASSMLTREAYERLASLAPQLPQAPGDISRIRLTCTTSRDAVAFAKSFADLSFDLEMLSPAQAAAEDLMLGMRMVQGVGPGLLAHARTQLGSAALDEAVDWCVGRGLASWQGQRLVPTEQGWLLGNELYGALWDLAPGEVIEA